MILVNIFKLHAKRDFADVTKSFGDYFSFVRSNRVTQTIKGREIQSETKDLILRKIRGRKMKKTGFLG